MFDQLVFPGTGVLDDFCTAPWGLPYDLFRWCLAARLRGVKIQFVSVGAGPINHPLSRRFMRSAAWMADYRSFRDTVSKAFMHSIGLDTSHDAVYPDIAFSLPSESASVSIDANQPLTVGVGVMSYFGWLGRKHGGDQIYHDYIAKMTRFVQWLLDHGHRVRLLIGDMSDEPTVDELRRNVLASRRVPAGQLTSEPMRSFADVARQVSAVDVVVATRFHNVVCALMLCRPLVSIGYAKKNDVLMAEMGLGRYCQRLEDLDVDALITQFQELVRDRSSLAQRLATQQARYRQQLQEQFDTLLMPDAHDPGGRAGLRPGPLSS